MDILNKWIDKLLQDGLMNRAAFDTYERETNRYGGINLIVHAEEVFYADSLFVMSVLSQFDMQNTDDRDLVFATGICSAFYELTVDLEEMFNMLDDEKLRTAFRNDFQSKKGIYIDVIMNIIAKEPEKIDPRFQEAKVAYNMRSKVLSKYRRILEREIEMQNIPKRKADILNSMVHMFCNRILGDTRQEAKYLAIVRHLLHAYLSQKEHQKI